MTGWDWLAFSKGKCGWLEVCGGVFWVKDGDLIFFMVKLVGSTLLEVKLLDILCMTSVWWRNVKLQFSWMKVGKHFYFYVSLYDGEWKNALGKWELMDLSLVYHLLLHNPFRNALDDILFRLLINIFITCLYIYIYIYTYIYIYIHRHD